MDNLKNLQAFFKRSSSFFLFLLLEIIALALMVSGNNFQRVAFWTTANCVGGGMMQGIAGVADYFHLFDQNEVLMRENVWLKQQLLQAEARLQEIGVIQDSVCSVPECDSLPMIRAKVIASTVNKFQNYITLDKGRSDGLLPDMGVAGPEGVVGVVAGVSNHYALVLPILHPSCRISCRLDSCQDFGSLVWDGVDAEYAYLEEIPRHVRVKEGETLSTSGFSAIFPAGILAGRVESLHLAPNDRFYTIKVRLATDFRRLRYVDVFALPGKAEIDSLQQQNW